ncbi:uncharacterized protein LOC112341909 isoform X2 [Selaginella moellendorffii]|uniref:uncharacterized protein LOC112341909 isoform X2 n=1 Tax=Selaginella moellendorffii TaxID=88036 RepID=UPI000D1C86D6|nr:uncharacterized protein LOC112341909 isoform X2 [Selaginella moellendorffii]|eukprot:XP_024518672.1 uncharacterized protein LOC112341909 isoform X2 [Selaginella moellendorffii]
MSRRRRGGAQSSGRSSRESKSHCSNRSHFVEAGFLSDWKPKEGRGKHRGTRKDLDHEFLVVEDEYKRRPSRDGSFPIPSEAQIILAALPTRAAVFEDKGSSMDIPSCSRRSTKTKTPRSNKAKNHTKYEKKPSSSSSSDSEDDCSSSVDSDLAEDYAGNLGNEVSLEELSTEMAMRAMAMKVALESGDEIDEEFFLSDSDDDESADGDDGSSSSESVVHAGLGYKSGDSSSEDDDDVEAVFSRQGARLKCLDLSDNEELIGVIEPSFILDKGRIERKGLDTARWQKGVPGERKKYKKELIARKRRERALHRGVDLESMNVMFESMVLSECDMLALQPMKHRDLTLVNKLAAVYRLKVGAHGSGKKRFPTVTRTRHTALPQGLDIQQMLKLLGREKELDDSPPKAKKGEAGRLAAKYKRAARHARASMARENEKLEQHGKRNKKPLKKRKDGERSSSIQQQPPSFVSSGVLQPGDNPETPVVLFSETSVTVRSKESVDKAPLGSFEAHTKGFGSRMLAKMGFVEGSGLGRNGQGMTQPLLPRSRPKSLGLGA